MARSNKRIIYAQQAVGIRPTNISNNLLGGTYVAKGVQELGIATNFNNTPYFELGQLAIYEDVEELPDIQVTISKALDGRPLLYHLATSTAQTVSPTLAGRQNNQCVLTVGLFPDTNDFATNTPPSIVECSGLFPSSLQYTFPVNGTFTESMTLIGNDKIWKNDIDITNPIDLARRNALQFPVDPNIFNADTPTIGVAPIISGDSPVQYFLTGVQRRQHLNFTPWSFYGVRSTDVNGMAADPFCTILPPDVDGISISGTNDKSDNVNFDAHIQNINVSVNLGRDELNELGRRGPYSRVIKFPVEVTCAIEIISTSGDLVSATEGGIRSTSTSSCAAQTNLSNRTIRVATCHKEVFYLGTKNKLTSVQVGGGGTDGANQTVTYNFRNYNTLTIMAFSDPHEDTNAMDGLDNGLSSPVNSWWNTKSDGTQAATSGSYSPGAYYLVN